MKVLSKKAEAHVNVAEKVKKDAGNTIIGTKKPKTVVLWSSGNKVVELREKIKCLICKENEHEVWFRKTLKSF